MERRLCWKICLLVLDFVQPMRRPFQKKLSSKSKEGRNTLKTTNTGESIGWQKLTMGPIRRWLECHHALGVRDICKIDIVNPNGNRSEQQLYTDILSVHALVVCKTLENQIKRGIGEIWWSSSFKCPEIWCSSSLYFIPFIIWLEHFVVGYSTMSPYNYVTCYMITQLAK